MCQLGFVHSVPAVKKVLPLQKLSQIKTVMVQSVTPYILINIQQGVYTVPVGI